jgi:ABC-type phosphate transport system substrate-binding protein
MFPKRPRSSFTFAAMLMLSASLAPVVTLTQATPTAAQAATPTFTLPTTIPNGTKVRISSGSASMNVLSEALKSGFEGKYAGSSVALSSKSADAAIQDVLTGKADLAAISRPLTDAQKAQGLTEVPASRQKIAMVVGADNPFSGSLSSDQFAKIFRGELTDWSKVGGQGTIRFIDRPATSDTRSSLASYPVFKVAPFETGANTTALAGDDNAALAQALGKDGIGYMLAPEAANIPGIKVLKMHQTLPSDPRYPFSQPFAYVYKGEPSPAVSAFLGYATTEPGQTALGGLDWGKLGDMAGKVGAAANNAAGQVGDAAGQTGDAVKQAANNVGDAANNAAGQVGDAANNAAGQVGDAANNAAGQVGDAAGQVGDAANNAAGQVGDAAGGIAAQVPGRWFDWRWLLLAPAAFLGWWLLGAGRRKDRTREEVTTVGGFDSDLDANLSNIRRDRDLDLSGIDLPNGRIDDPDITLPDLNAPNVNMPGLPNVNMPNVNMPNVNMPNVNMPDIGKAVAGGAAVAGGLGAAAWTTLQNTKDSAVGAGKQVIDQAGNLAEQAGQPMRGLFDGSGNPIRGFFDAAGKPIVNVYDAAGSPTRFTLDAMGNPSPSIFDAAGNPILTVFDGSGHPIRGLFDATGKSFQGILGFGQGILQEGTTKVRNIANQAQNAVQGLGNIGRVDGDDLSLNNVVDDAQAQWDQAKNLTNQKGQDLTDDAVRLYGEGMDRLSDISDTFKPNP